MVSSLEKYGTSANAHFNLLHMQSLAVRMRIRHWLDQKNARKELNKTHQRCLIEMRCSYFYTSTSTNILAKSVKTHAFFSYLLILISHGVEIGFFSLLSHHQAPNKLFYWRLIWSQALSGFLSYGGLSKTRLRSYAPNSYHLILNISRSWNRFPLVIVPSSSPW
jgi:hypothetical protein